MLIGEIVSKTGFTKDTIRFYEKRGIIKVNRSDSEWNNYKNYSAENLEQLLLIKRAKGFGFTLNEIAELLGLVEKNEATCDVLLSRVECKLEEIDRKIEELKSFKQMIIGMIGSNDNCEPRIDQSNCKSLT